eukprot:m.65795 g.65795  ORF g.65795 m.65795 type:complete len:207 (+) comp19666_c0_seq3:427-1047(+)
MGRLDAPDVGDTAGVYCFPFQGKHNYVVILTSKYRPPQQEQVLQWFKAPEIVDFVHAMCYDQSQKHSTWEFFQRCVNQAKQSLPIDKVTIGLPFYGRSIQTGDWKTYEDILKTLPEPLDTSLDETRDGYYFNGRDTITRKTEYVFNQGLGGVMIWESGQDCLSGVCHPAKGEYDASEVSLHVAISNLLKQKNKQNEHDIKEKRDEL